MSDCRAPLRVPSILCESSPASRDGRRTERAGVDGAEGELMLRMGLSKENGDEGWTRRGGLIELKQKKIKVRGSRGGVRSIELRSNESI
jgi:hypothetical protein